MGFVINEEQKIRISLSMHATLIIQDDMRIFEVTKPTSFINTIIENFRDEAKAAIQKYLTNKRLDLENKFQGSKLTQEQVDFAITHLLKQEETAVKKQLKDYQQERYSCKAYHINKDNINHLVYDCPDNDFFLNKPGRYLKCILEEYASYPFIIRERIVKKDIYQIVERACLNGSLLTITKMIDSHMQTMHVYPYKIVSDPLNTQEYLACYTRKQNAPSKDKRIASFAMARLDEIKELKHSAFLSEKDKRAIETMLSQHSAAFLTGREQKIRIRFTEQGKRLYRIRLQSRPDIVKELDDQDIYEFTCSEHQAYNYFFSFGDAIEILSPQSLRDKMKTQYQNALTLYTS